jgi:hypothetical protein
MYASKPRPTDLTPKTITYFKDIELGYDCVLTLKQLAKYGVDEDCKFSIYHDEDDGYTLSITKKRLETDKEIAKRVKADLAYKKGYDEFIKKYPRK